MTIACLGWGSLIWDPREFPLSSDWHDDGPLLPIEFARFSKRGRVTLVIVAGCRMVPSLWAEVAVTSLENAVEKLRIREDRPPRSSIGYWTEKENSGHLLVQEIGHWARERRIQAVVWAALPPKNSHGNEVKPGIEEVLKRLKNSDPEERRAAEQYIRKAHSQIRTEYRDIIERELGWNAGN